MELEQVAWVVHRPVVDARLDELDLHVPTTELFRSPIRPIRLPSDLLGLDTRALEDVARQALSVLAGTDAGGPSPAL
jgi:hypothetical protein